MKKAIFSFAMVAIVFSSCKKCLECGYNGEQPLYEVCKDDVNYKCLKKGECIATDIAGNKISCK